jgi:hypothetical protein
MANERSLENKIKNKPIFKGIDFIPCGIGGAFWFGRNFVDRVPKTNTSKEVLYYIATEIPYLLYQGATWIGVPLALMTLFKNEFIFFPTLLIESALNIYFLHNRTKYKKYKKQDKII